MQKIILILALMMLLTGCKRADSEMVLHSEESTILLTEEHEDSSGQKDLAEAVTLEASTAAEEVLLGVYVCGAVNNPGVYYLSDGSRLIDAVDAAGGFSVDADVTYVNLAATVQDGIKLQIPTIEQVESAANSSSLSSYDGNEPAAETDSNGLVNINKASKEELKTLPGIGDGIAGRIIDYRTENGDFSKIEDIMKISGIKDKMFSKIKDRITV
ncbi:helix-hairpin-helix domain-containing protein [Butyrivibrio sp. YAB3001]|uniref:helix-hairpin-helix domain-containing protein n=1 Tax=Butyrivibrio sp. YAB3001 TaxID=1520812 RepID=UPI0008F62B4F|nr:helix-hairpin-helix domain-containing protein [Butyrivibrio sp. YAB3001]SFB72170.1 competence protein ComEA [Butyrivibrio sp. YAB3001]